MKKLIEIKKLVRTAVDTAHTIRGLYQKCGLQPTDSVIKGCYPYIPVYETALELIIEHQKSFKNLVVCDAGAGTSVIADLFFNLGAKEAKALEINTNYYPFIPYNCLIKGDILTYHFGEFDVIYTFRPLHDKELMLKGLKNIVNTMKKGAKLYFVYGDDLPKKADIEVEYLSDGAFSSEDVFVYTKK